jgi:hypothetical protein
MIRWFHMIVWYTRVKGHGWRNPRFVPAWHMAPAPFWRSEEEAGARRGERGQLGRHFLPSPLVPKSPSPLVP